MRQPNGHCNEEVPAGSPLKSVGPETRVHLLFNYLRYKLKYLNI